MDMVMGFIEQAWAWIQAHPNMALNGLGGAVLGPILSKILRGGMGTGILGGLAGGIGAGFGADMAGLNEIVSSNLPAMGEDGMIVSYLQNLAEGAVGGGGAGGILGAILKRR